MDGKRVKEFVGDEHSVLRRIVWYVGYGMVKMELDSALWRRGEFLLLDCTQGRACFNEMDV